MFKLVKVVAAVAALVMAVAPAHAQRGGKEMSSSTFLRKAAAAGMAEVAMSQLALERASSPAVQEFAQRMVMEHSQNNEQLMAVAGQVGVAVPAAIEPRHAATMQRLSMLSGPQFDAEYMAANVRSHRNSVALFQRGASEPDSSAVQQYARMSLPILRDHLGHAQSVLQSPHAASAAAPPCVPQPVYCASYY